MKRVHIVGRKNSGKTTLVVELIESLTAAGYRVGTIKHTHHHHELDTPGKDSHRHGEAGSAVVGILSPGKTAVFQRCDDDSRRDASRYTEMAPMFAGCDLVLVEGDLQTRAAKIEVWCSGSSRLPIAATDPSILAVVSDDAPQVSVPVWERSQVDAIASHIVNISFSLGAGAL